MSRFRGRLLDFVQARDQRKLSRLSDLMIALGEIMTEQKPWTPTDEDYAALKAYDAPHEPAAVLRAFRAGYSGSSLAKAVGMTPGETVARMSIALGDENMAHAQGREIHDAKIYGCKLCGGTMYEQNGATGTPYYKCPVDYQTYFPPKADK